MTTSLSTEPSVSIDVQEGVQLDERRNGFVFLAAITLGYLAAPVLYVGVVQAALCNILGANATVANLPQAAYMIGSVAPVFASWFIPYSRERDVVVWSGALGGIMLGMVGCVLILPFSNTFRIAIVISQSLIYGLAASIQMVYLYQCLNRGTSEQSRARALKLSFSLGPIAAVIGSLSAQYIVNSSFPILQYPYNFASLYFFGALCMMGMAIAGAMYRIRPLAKEVRPALISYMWQTMAVFFGSRSLLLLWLAYVLWYSAISSMPNLSLYAKHVIGKEPETLVGIILALRFGFKALSGYVQGTFAQLWGVRAPLISVLVLMLTSISWAILVPGYPYLFTFALIGAAELGGIYFPNYCLAISSYEAGARNLSVLTLAVVIGGFSSTLHGAITDSFGFIASFTFAGICALFSLFLVLRLPIQPNPTK